MAPDLEARHQVVQVDRQARQLLAGSAGLVGAGGRLQRQVTNVDQISVDLARHLGLFFRSTGNHQVALADLADRTGDAIERFPGGARQIQRGSGALVAQLHGVHRFVGSLVHITDHLFDLLGRLLGAMGQCTHLVGHYGETTARIPARAASMAALSASRLVCSAIERITSSTC